VLAADEQKSTEGVNTTVRSPERKSTGDPYHNRSDQTCVPSDNALSSTRNQAFV